MKKLLLFLVMLISVNASSEWNWQNPYPAYKDFYSISFINSQTGWISGYKGTLTKTTNGGTTWIIISNVPQSTGYSIKFFNANTGYITGITFLKSTNGGFNWTQMILPMTDANKSFFLNANTGWIGTFSGQVWRTSDAGIHWRQLQALSTHINDLFFTDDQTGWLVGRQGAIYKTSDGGFNWSFQKNGASGELNSVYFANPNTGWAVGDNGVMLSTIDGGSVWTYQMITSSNLESVSFIDSKTGLAVGSGGKVFKTTNGTDWFAQVSNDNHNFQSVNFISDNVGYAAGLNGAVIKTTNGGFNWVNLAYVTTSSLQSVHFANIYSGWTVGSEGTVLKSTNCGATWFRQGISTNDTYRGVMAVSSSVVWIVGDNGIILRTTNGGTNWSNQQSGTNAGLYSVYFVNTNTGWITGNHVILKTTNSGTNWVYKNGMEDSEGRCIFFINNNTGWIAASSIWKTIDGGETWALKTKLDINSICFINYLTGYAVGGSLLLKSIDGGLTWGSDTNDKEYLGDDLGNGQPADLTSVSYFDEKSGWYTSNKNVECKVLGKSGTGISTIHNILNCVYTFNQNYAWAVGEGGTIVRTTNGGTIFVNSNVNEIPTAYVLMQNYPNPFNPSTTIKFSIPKLSVVKIAVYDLTGKEISVLVNEQMQAGSYETNWNGANYSSGVYFYRITSGDFSETKRMLLIK